MSLKKPVRAAKTAAPAKKTAEPAARPGAVVSKSAANSMWSAWAIVIGILGVVVVAALFAAHGQQPTQEATVADAHPAAATPADAKPMTARKVSSAAVVSDDADGAPASNKVSGGVEVTGCMQRDNDGFVLKDTEGAAPKSRSWKTGFLKKSSSSIELTDSGNAAHLKDHVGQRVSVIGTLIDREMHVQSVHRLAATCN